MESIGSTYLQYETGNYSEPFEVTFNAELRAFLTKFFRAYFALAAGY